MIGVIGHPITPHRSDRLCNKIMMINRLGPILILDLDNTRSCATT